MLQSEHPGPEGNQVVHFVKELRRPPTHARVTASSVLPRHGSVSVQYRVICCAKLAYAE